MPTPATQQKQQLSRLSSGIALVVWLLLACGCFDSLAMVGKVIVGDPIQPSGFEIATGIDLRDEHSRILVHCTSPSYVTSDYATLTSDLQQELIRRLKRRGLAVLGPDAATDILDDHGGTFNPRLLASKMEDVDYIMLISVETFQYRVEQSSDLYRGQTSGHVVAYQVDRQSSTPQVLKVYDQEFHTLFPSAQPVQADQVSKNVFIRQFIDEIADDLGHSFYSVNRSDLFAR